MSTEEEPKERSGEGDQWKAESSDEGTGDRDEVESPEMGRMQFVPKMLRFMPERLTKMEIYSTIQLY